jgi:predicted ATPase with chaperone activity
MLDLHFDTATRFYQAPPHLKANNGIFIIDDLGRQRCSAVELMVVFSTNLNPSQLADEAFLRRIQTKVMVDNVSNEVFDEIFRRVVEKHQAPAEPGAAEHLRLKCRAAGSDHLHACYPMDIYRVVKSISEYEGRAVRMTREAIDRAVALYFARS